MLDLGLLDARMFSLWLNPDVSELAAGEIRFGGADPSRRAGDLVELPVVSEKCAAQPHALEQRRCTARHGFVFRSYGQCVALR